MYRVVLLALIALTVIAIVESLFALVAPGPAEIAVTVLVLVAVCVGVDAVAQRLIRRPLRLESSLITALILGFVLRPTLDPVALAGIAVAAAVAAASKYLLAWRGRHIFNPAAMGAAALTVLSLAFPALGASAWWVGTPALAVPMLLLAALVLIRTERVRVIVLFLVVAWGIAFLRTMSQYAQVGESVQPLPVFWQILWSSPFLFLGVFMLSEPLTLPPRRWQQLTIALVVGVLAGWPIDLGAITLGQERALLIGNAVAFFFSARTAVRLILRSRAELSPSIRELSFHAEQRFAFRAGQFVELDVPHHHPDARGTRREFSILSAPSDLPVVRVAFREDHRAQQLSSYKRALAALPEGAPLTVTGVWGDFLLPHEQGKPLLMVAAGIGITPFVSQLRQLRAADEDRDVVLVYVAAESSELAFRDEIAATKVPVVVFTRDQPADLPAHWVWARGVRLDADGLLRVVPDLSARHAFVSGPPRLIAELAPALNRARSLTTDAFSGY